MTNSQPKPLAKALHTVSVLANLAQYLRSEKAMPIEDAVNEALDILGYEAGCPDKDACVSKAIAKLCAFDADCEADARYQASKDAERRMSYEAGALS